MLKQAAGDKPARLVPLEDRTMQCKPQCSAASFAEASSDHGELVVTTVTAGNWEAAAPASHGFAAALGQRPQLFPLPDLVLVVTAGAYDGWNTWQLAARFMTEVLFPAFERP